MSVVGKPLVRFNQPPSLGMELELVREAVEKNRDIAGDGAFTREAETILNGMLGSRAILVTSATSALEMMALLLHLQPGDEVILPSFTFVSTANAFVLRGARVVFADCDAYGNIDLEHAAGLVTPRTRALCVVHYGGTSCDMDKAAALCRRHGIALLEDAAQALGADFRGRPLGSFGAMACLSFHQTKNVSCGEGGALLVNDPELWDRAQILKQKGTNRHQFVNGLVDKYSWVDVGSSYILAELNAAFLAGQLRNFAKIQARRRRIWELYELFFRDKTEFAAKFLRAPDANSQNWHLAALVFENEGARRLFQRRMREEGIECSTHFVPLHSSPFATARADLVRVDGTYRETNRLAACLLRLPIYFNLEDRELGLVLAAAEKSGALSKGRSPAIDAPDIRPL